MIESIVTVPRSFTLRGGLKLIESIVTRESERSPQLHAAGRIETGSCVVRPDRPQRSPQLHAAGRIETVVVAVIGVVGAVPRSFTLRGGLKPKKFGDVFSFLAFPAASRCGAD